ncbi:MAG: flagellar biosynthesis regulator FlaF [Thalassovita sp.]
MNALLSARRAYAQSAGPVRTPRGVEYEAFARITRQLKSAGTTGSIRRLAPSIHDNRRLWTLLATDVADPNNSLPSELRARIFYLAEFTQQHSREVLRGKANVDALVEINLSVMRGLRQTEDAS